MIKVLMTSKEFVARLKALVSRETFYKSKYPENLCYIHADGKISADGIGLYKSILNGYDVEETFPGYFQKDLSNTSDCTEYGLIRQCSDVSTDFSLLKHGEPRLLYKEGHVGAYLGEEIVLEGKIYNAIECTLNWQGGILYSYVDSTGCRFNFKGGSKNKFWAKHGKLTPWVEYTESVKQEDDVKEYYVVQKDDSLSKIAIQYGTTWQKLMALNNIKNPNFIYAGERIRVK